MRFTADLDLIVQLERKNISRFFSTVEGIGYIPKGPVTKEPFIDKKTRQEWIRPKSIKVFSFFHSKNCLKVIDIFIKKPFVFETIENDFTLIRIADFKIPVLSIKHLIKLKKNVNHTQDLIDIANLKALHYVEQITSSSDMVHEHLKHFQKSSYEERLNWLEEANEFVLKTRIRKENRKRNDETTQSIGL
ncbi:MAG: hypothetical protein HZA48_10955 [Planctomycetes bacterium]|nr:hypothetical protein [Planctomycetota bacterium]